MHLFYSLFCVWMQKLMNELATSVINNNILFIEFVQLHLNIMPKCCWALLDLLEYIRLKVGQSAVYFIAVSCYNTHHWVTSSCTMTRQLHQHGVSCLPLYYRYVLVDDIGIFSLLLNHVDRNGSNIILLYMRRFIYKE